ncbi:MAG: VWA domain-containing protein [Anaerolineae bacterium]|nr:VWA domain-containing protein [Anaerolineae bacterium]
MDKRMVEFIRALRAAGVRISLAESQDAVYGVDEVGVDNQNHFKSTLKSTLVKEAHDHQVFDYFYPLFFASNVPPLQNIPENLTPEEQEMLQQALRSLVGLDQALQDLLRQLLEGQAFNQDQLDQMGEDAGLNQANEMYQRPWFERRMNQQAQMERLRQMLEQLLDQLQAMGMSQEKLDELREMMQENMQGLSEQLSNFVGSSVAQQMAQQEPEAKPDISDIPFSRLSQADIDQIRDEIRRLAARLRSRASLRQKRAKMGDPDPRRTIRANLRYGGTPIELKTRTHHKKPALVVICDISTSVRYCTEFLLTLIYELQDQVARTNSFVFISDLVDISMEFKEHEPREAVARVMNNNRPGYYNTDLGNSLNTFKRDHMGLITGRTTVIILGDGRNNYSNPRLDIAQDIQRKARRLIWFCPEPRSQWGTGDSDMHLYAANADGVHYVNTLNDLANAVDSILADG